MVSAALCGRKHQRSGAEEGRRLQAASDANPTAYVHASLDTYRGLWGLQTEQACIAGNTYPRAPERRKLAGGDRFDTIKGLY